MIINIKAYKVIQEEGSPSTRRLIFKGPSKLKVTKMVKDINKFLI